MAAGELSRRRGSSWTGARRLALLIAVGIGLHNFGEGLAIGGSAARGEIALATLLVVGFALHNARRASIVARWPPKPNARDGHCCSGWA